MNGPQVIPRAQIVLVTEIDQALKSSGQISVEMVLPMMERPLTNPVMILKAKAKTYEFENPKRKVQKEILAKAAMTPVFLPCLSMKDPQKLAEMKRPAKKPEAIQAP